MTDDERAELETLRAEARLFNDALYADVRQMQRLDLVQTEEAIMAAIDWIRSDCDSDGEHVLTLLWAAAKRLSSPAQSPPPQTPPTPPAD